MEVQSLIQPAQVTQTKKSGAGSELNKMSIFIPPNRMTPLKNNWTKICETVVQNMKLQTRVNSKKRTVQVRQCAETEDSSALQRTADLLKAFMLGFDLEDAIAFLRLDDLLLESFHVKDVKNLQGDHMGRCIARLSGQKGKTKHAIENATRTRIVIADSNIHVMGSFTGLRAAKDALCSLIMGTPPGKVYSQLKFVSKRLQQKM